MLLIKKRQKRSIKFNTVWGGIREGEGNALVLPSKKATLSFYTRGSSPTRGSEPRSREVSLLDAGMSIKSQGEKWSGTTCSAEGKEFQLLPRKEIILTTIPRRTPREIGSARGGAPRHPLAREKKKLLSIRDTGGDRRAFRPREGKEDLPLLRLGTPVLSYRKSSAVLPVARRKEQHA